MQTLIAEYFKVANLTQAQRADLQSSNGGAYIPDSPEVAMIEVQIMILEENNVELIKLYKRLPAPQILSDDLATYLSLTKSSALSQAKLENPSSLIGTPLADRDYRLNHLYNIIDKKHKKNIIRLNKAQVILDNIINNVHPRAIVLKSRQRGISTYALVSALDTCLTQPNKIKGLQANGLAESNALMEKAKLAYESIPDTLKPRLVYSNNSVLEFSNGSKIRISTSFRGQTLSSLHISELGKISLNLERSRELTTGTFPALPLNEFTQVTLESTSEGAGNLFYDMWDDAVTHYKKGDYSTFYPIFIGWVGIIDNGQLLEDTADPDCWAEPTDCSVPNNLDLHLQEVQNKLGIEFTDGQVEWAINQLRLLGGDITEFQKEYPCTIEDCWAASGEGLILANSFMSAKRDEDLKIDPKYPLYAASDLGVGDTSCTLWFQLIKNKIHIVDEVFGTGKPISFYTHEVLKRGTDVWYLPHDANNRDLSTSKKVVTHIRNAGFTNYRVMKRAKNQWVDISRVRELMPNIVFGNVPNTISAIKAYRKVWSNQTGTYLDKALHDDNSNYADALRYVVAAILDFLKV